MLVGARLLALLLRNPNKMQKQRTRIPTEAITGRIYLKKCLRELETLESITLQDGKPNLGAPHNAAFPSKDMMLAFIKAPTFGTFPSNMLKDKLRMLRCRRLIKDSGITPVILLQERFKTSRLMRLPNDLGMCPSNELFD
ncbi:uncharacterized protein A4U43_C08F3220, partial [Asparagus officinalis]